MKIIWGFSLSLLLLTGILLGLTQAQNEDLGEKEESNIPKKVLRKYRIRRPVILDENGNAVSPPSVPRLRRIRVNKPSSQEQSSPAPVANSLETGNLYNGYNFQAQAQPQALVQRQAVYDEGQPGGLEPIRVVPTYRKATPSSTRSALLANVNYKDRGVTGEEETTKKQPIGTTRNYSKINEDGSFTFGYEGEDGSFKEETRGTDCVVRGKYGYVDPDGVQREFSYVSGNPCDPNNPDQDEGHGEEDEDTIPNRVTPISRPRRPVINTNVQQNLDVRATEEPIPVVYRVGQRQQRIQPTPQPQFQQPTTFRPRYRYNPQPTTTPAPPSPFQLQQLHGRSAKSTFRQPSPSAGPFPLLDERGANGAFDFDQELQRIQYQAGPSVAPPQSPYHQQQPQFQQFQPQFQHFPQPAQPTQPTTPRFGPGSVHRFPHRQYFGGSNAANLFPQQPVTPTPTVPQIQRSTPAPFQQQQPRPVLPQPQVQTNSIQDGQGIDYGQYRTELVYDPSTGRYMSVLVQDSPKADEQLTLTQRLRGFVEPNRQDQQPRFQIQMFGQPQVQYFPQQQQQQQQPQQFHQQFQRPQFQPHQYQQYQPSTGSITGLHADSQEAINSPASGQIDAFLRNLNIQA